METLKNTPRNAWQTREWSWEGRRLFLELVDRLSDDAMAAPSLLPGWSRATLVAHVAQNARALRNLVTWAKTGVETPMYASKEQRQADIEETSALPPSELKAFLVEQSEGLVNDCDDLTPEQWQSIVRTNAGREVPLTEIAWMRAREVMVHAVDLDAGIRFADLPQAFNAALIDDIASKRSASGDGPNLHLETRDARGVERDWDIAGQGDPVVVVGPLASATAWLAGRPVKLLSTASGEPLPELGPWL